MLFSDDEDNDVVLQEGTIQENIAGDHLLDLDLDDDLPNDVPNDADMNINVLDQLIVMDTDEERPDAAPNNDPTKEVIEAVPIDDVQDLLNAPAEEALEAAQHEEHQEEALLDDGMQEVALGDEEAPVQHNENIDMVPTGPDNVKPKARVVRSAPVKRKPEKWIVRDGVKSLGVRKSRRVASVKCREKIRKLAAKLARSDSEDEHGDDEGRHEDDVRIDCSQPLGIPQVDGNYTIENVFSAIDIEYYTNTNEFARRSEELRNFPERASKLMQSLDLVIPNNNPCEHFATAANGLARSRVMSISDGQLSQVSHTDHRPSIWRRRLRRLRRFLDNLPFRK